MKNLAPALTLALALALILAIAPATNAEAAPARKKKAPPPPPSTEFSVAIPSSEIELKQPEEDTTGEGSSIEVALSSWSPSNFTRKTYLGQTGSFHAGTIPYVSLNVRYPFAHYSNGANLAVKAGFSGTNLEREGSVGLTGGTVNSTQTLNLFMARAGVEYQALRFSFLQPYVGLALLPSVALSAKSTFEDRVSAFGVPLEGTLGLIARPQLFKDLLGLTHGALGIGAHYIFGSIDESRLNGLGVQGFFQLSL